MGCGCGQPAYSAVVGYRYSLPVGRSTPEGETQLDFLRIKDARDARALYGGGTIRALRRTPTPA